jgi:hypothetical protein
MRSGTFQNMKVGDPLQEKSDTNHHAQDLLRCGFFKNVHQLGVVIGRPSVYCRPLDCLDGF